MRWDNEEKTAAAGPVTRKAKTNPFIAIWFLGALALARSMCLPAHAQCNIYPGTNQQVIDGFGFSSAWCGTLSSAKNNARYNTLGMSLLRIRIDENNNWTDEINNANAAHAAGGKVFGTAWYGPAAWWCATELKTPVLQSFIAGALSRS